MIALKHRIYIDETKDSIRIVMGIQSILIYHNTFRYSKSGSEPFNFMTNLNKSKGMAIIQSQVDQFMGHFEQTKGWAHGIFLS